MPDYTVKHITRFRYETPARESIMEVRARPLDSALQTCLSFTLQISPRAIVREHRDWLGNHVHDFTLPAAHMDETISAESTVRISAPPPLPEALPAEAWAAYDDAVNRLDAYDMLLPSHFAKPTDALAGLMQHLQLERANDPLTTIRRVVQSVHDHFEYHPQATHVDSPIDEVIAGSAGVCQDFAHVTLAVLRALGVPCRYISGYICGWADPQTPAPDAPQATHAWIEALLPVGPQHTLQWVGFDPTHNEVIAERHIRIAVGRDYRDVPPTRGVYRGDSASTLEVEVNVEPLTGLQPWTPPTVDATGWTPPETPTPIPDEQPISLDFHQQMMQQQQNENPA